MSNGPCFSFEVSTPFWNLDYFSDWLDYELYILLILQKSVCDQAVMGQWDRVMYYLCYLQLLDLTTFGGQLKYYLRRV